MSVQSSVCGFLVAVAGTFLLPIGACECLPTGPSDPAQSLAGAAAVFTGYVVDINLASRWVPHGAPRPADCDLLITQEGGNLDLCFEGDVVVTFQVTASWKGAELGLMKVRTPAQSTACGYSFQVRDSYLVFANRSKADGGLVVTSCGATKRDREAVAERAALGSPLLNAYAGGAKPEPRRR